MALFGNIGGLLAGGLSILGQAPGAVGSFGQIGSTFLTSAIAAQPQRQTFLPATGPTVAMAGGGQIVQFAGRALSIGAAATSMIAPVLIKIATFLGRRTMSLRKAISLAKRLAKAGMSPTAVAAALGITVAELADLIVADSQRPRRRMNPANISALRRSMRRLASFHRLCIRADTLRRGRGGRRRGASCPPAGVQVVRGG